jgi:hypothetical protein
MMHPRPTPLPLRITLYAFAVFTTLLGPATLRAAHDLRRDTQAPAAIALPAPSPSLRRLPDSVRDLPPSRVIDHTVNPTTAQVVPSTYAVRPQP